MKDRHSKNKNHCQPQEAPEEAAASAEMIPLTPAVEAPPPESAEGAREVDALKDQLLRLHADFDNFRKRTQREQAEIGLRANESLLKELLPVVDHFELGLQNAVKAGALAAVADGLKLVYDQFLTALRKFGLEPVNAEKEIFDPHKHEAITYVPSEEIPAETVIAQTRRGYKLGDRLLRAAQVVVSSGPAQPAADSTGPDGQNKEN
ncbi:MAG TPA: nucleotide exchange factor GrpE [Verrucomicrobia bacterium]|nr:MAG: nucleotide exchange factor GrpE [Lentisphaerae bacterium GWF2_57_35]HBA82637.1 nucleotide exchange factor GrpE [Verrucomicrobiota bacterium]